MDGRASVVCWRGGTGDATGWIVGRIVGNGVNAVGVAGAGWCCAPCILTGVPMDAAQVAQPPVLRCKRFAHGALQSAALALHVFGNQAFNGGTCPVGRGRQSHGIVGR